MLTSTDLELRADLSLGSLTSNAEQLKTFVEQRLKDYTPAKYEGRAAEAKADRAVLNSAEKTINARRLELERKYMEPFAEFKAIITDTCKLIKQASGQLDEIVKAEETREKEGKRLKIKNYWDRQNFTLFDLEKIWDDRWLNKTTKDKDYQEAIDNAIQKTLDELKVLERFPAEDVPLLKSVYLETLSISDAMNKAEILKANRDRLAREAKEREAIAQRDALREQEREEQQDEYDNKAETNAESLVSAALDIPDAGPAKEDYALVLHGTRKDLLAVRQAMTNLGVIYRKLSPIGDGLYGDGLYTEN